MFGYHGSKANVARYYPRPLHNRIIEPFSGSARYSFLYWYKDVTLVDKYDVITRVFKWLQQCSPRDIAASPPLKIGDNLDDFDFDCEERKMLLGFIVNPGVASPRKAVTGWGVRGYRKKLKFISKNLYKIKSWNIVNGDYNSIDNVKATWFIDPPYIGIGEGYVYNDSGIDYAHLAEWCKSRIGQVIVCEGHKASWLPFKQFVVNSGRVGPSTEFLWYRKHNENGH